MKIYRYSGASESFVLIDGRGLDSSHYTHHSYVRTICAIHGADGLMILEDAADCDFRLGCYLPDGTRAALPGRDWGCCATAFAELLNILPLNGKYGGKGSDGVCEYRFITDDGIHRAWILTHLGDLKHVRLELPGPDGGVILEEGPVLCEGDLIG